MAKSVEVEEGMKLVFDRPACLHDKGWIYCPGCGHGVVHRLLAEVIDELGIQDKTIGMASVGCSVFNYENFDVDMISCSHGRAPAAATGVKRVHPGAFVFTYQGDGDLASIGTGEIVHSANRGEKITVIFVNNAVYGMTSGQMAPTTLIGMKTTTTPAGRDPSKAGYPLHIVELLSMLPGVAYAARGSTHDARNILKTRSYIKKAAQAQLENRGFSIVEVLSNCTSNWKMDPAVANKWIETDMVKEFPLGVYKDCFAADGDKEKAAE
jgi:2-oxoglutarate ferredoxin oxidoreductase subunit beta